MSVGVFVLGMHRSGTSAATRLVNLLGVPTCVEWDFLPLASDNPTGHWESESLVIFNDRVLAAAGCDWTCPPAFSPGWEADPELERLGAEGRRLFRRLHPTEQWVWKDPRNCVTFAFWARQLEVRPVAVLVQRNPLEIAASLGARDGIDKLDCLALWERYLRTCLASISGIPTLVTDYADLLADPLAWSAAVREFLEDARVATNPIDEQQALAFVDVRLRHVDFGLEDLALDGEVSDEQRELYDAVRSLGGAHDALAVPVLAGETPSTEKRLALRRRVYELMREHHRRRLAFDLDIHGMNVRSDALERKHDDLGARLGALEGAATR